MSDLMLDVDQASEIKAAARRAGATNQDLKVLSSGDMMARILPVLRGVAEVVMNRFLTLITTVEAPVLPRFVALDHFKVGTSNSAEVKIAFICGGFARLLNKIEEATEATTLSIYKLEKDLLDKEIRAELGEYIVETTLSQFWHLLTKQGHGQTGVFLINGFANILYIRDDEGRLPLAVRASWCVGLGGWDLDAHLVVSPNGWHVEDQVISRN